MTTPPRSDVPSTASPPGPGRPVDGPVEPFAPDEAQRAINAVIAEISRAVIGKSDRMRIIIGGLLANGHVLLNDVPGVAKTLFARSFSQAAGLSFSRLQFTPDVLPSDITGYLALDLATNEPTFRPGPVFAQLVLADEINRSPAKTQGALLEAMAERHITIDGVSHRLPPPFMVIATQNPVESEGTYPLPEAQLDRFILETSIGYPNADAEREMLTRRLGRTTEQPAIRQVLAAGVFERLQATVQRVEVHEVIVDYIVRIITATRHHPDLALGASPRASLAMAGVARAVALQSGRMFVTPDDVRSVAIPTITHRLELVDEAWARGVHRSAVTQQIVDSIPAPSWD